MSLHIQNIRFRQLYCEHMRTKDQLFFNKSFFFFPKSCLKVGDAAYTRVFFSVFTREHRLMSTVLEFFSVRFTSGNNQNLTRVTSRLSW